QRGAQRSPARAGRPPAGTRYGRGAEESDNQRDADDAKLGHAFEEQGVSVADRHDQGAVLVPIGLVAAGAYALEGVGLEGIQGRRPELIAAAASPAAQMRGHVGALGLQGPDLLELLPPRRWARERDRHDDRDDGPDGDRPR